MTGGHSPELLEQIRAAYRDPELLRAKARLDAVLALHEDDGDGHCTTCVELLPAYWPCPTVRAARGET